MKLNEKKIALYAFLLLASGVGLLIDRLFARPGGQSTGRVMGMVLAQPNSVSEENLSGIGPPLAALFDPSRLGSAPDEAADPGAAPAASRDVFGLSHAMLVRYQSKAVPTEKERQVAEQKKAEEIRESAAAFGASHRLMGVFIGPADKWAIVDGRILRIGDQVDGFVLHRIDDYGAVFARGDDLRSLHLPTAFESKVGTAEPR